MSDLRFEILGARAEPFAASPLLMLRLGISAAQDDEIQAIALRAQIQIEPRGRRYTNHEDRLLTELFGTTDRWGDTLKTLFWTQVSVMVPGFTGSTEIDLPIACTYDFNVASSKYLNALEDGAIPIAVLFSGTLFREGAAGFAVEQVPWHSEAKYQLPARVWREVMDIHFPNSAWLRLHKSAFEELCAFKAARGLPSWEDVVVVLLDSARERQP